MPTGRRGKVAEEPFRCERTLKRSQEVWAVRAVKSVETAAPACKMWKAWERRPPKMLGRTALFRFATLNGVQARPNLPRCPIRPSFRTDLKGRFQSPAHLTAVTTKHTDAHVATRQDEGPRRRRIRQAMTETFARRSRRPVG